MATRGQLVLDQVAPVKVVDTRHVSSDVAWGRRGFLIKGN